MSERLWNELIGAVEGFPIGVALAVVTILAFVKEPGGDRSLLRVVLSQPTYREKLVSLRGALVVLWKDSVFSRRRP